MMRTLRQLCFDPELRIAQPRNVEVPDLAALLATLEPPPIEGKASATPDAHTSQDVNDLVAEVAAWSWEIARETERLGASTPAFLSHAVEGLRSALQHHDVKIQDLSGMDFDVRDNWDRVVSAPREKSKPYIARMMMPRILFRGALLRAGVPVVEDREEQP